MINFKRNEEIKEHFKKGTKVSALVKKYKLTAPRLWKIAKLDKKYCKTHNRNFYSNCVSCVRNVDFNLFTNSPAYKKIKKDLIALTKDNANPDKVRKMVAYLKDKQKLSFAKIASLMKRHHSTIIYHYKRSKIVKK